MQTERARTIIRNHLIEYMFSQENLLPTNEEIQQLMDEIFAGFGDYLIANGITDLSNFSQIYRDYLASEYVREKINSFVANIANRYAQVDITDEQMAEIAMDLYEDYELYAKENYLPEPSKMIDSFQAYLQTEEGKERFNEAIKKAINTDEIQAQLERNIQDVMKIYSSEIEDFMAQMMAGFADVMAEKLSAGLEEVMRSMANSFYFNADAFTGAISVNMDADSLTDLMMSMASGGSTSYASNLRALNYATLDNPSQITIYPKDFESKNRIIEIIEDYNKQMKKEEKEDKVISYTDTVATLMNSVTKMVDTISAVLIAFVAVSLIVSSIMIEIITYISVLERTKEIGILRALGASKKNISQVFNAETFIIGLLAGLFGIGLSAIIVAIGNYIVHNYLNAENITAVLPVKGAVVLIILSVILTYIGGLIPSRSAAKKDPVEALRTE